MLLTIQNEHPQYTMSKRNWKIVRDLIKGEDQLKLVDLSSLRRLGIFDGSSNNTSIRETMYLPYLSSSPETEDIQRYRFSFERGRQRCCVVTVKIINTLPNKKTKKKCLIHQLVCIW